MSLSDRVALVTGSSRGIGRAICERLAADGATVAVHHRTREDDAVAVADGIRAGGGRALVVGGDVGDPDAVEAIFAAVEAEAGPVDVLVNNAGVHRGGRVHALPLEDFELVMRTTLHGAFHCTRRAVPAMVDRGWGRIVNVSSVVALRGSPGDAAYSTAKAGLLGLTRSVAAELARTGVTANAVLPGFVLTEMTQSLSANARERLAGAIPAGRDGAPEEVAAGVAYLASAEAAYVTGAALPIDGGILL